MHAPYTAEDATVLVAQSAGNTASPQPAANVQTGTSADPGAVKAKQLIDQMIQTLGGDAYLGVVMPMRI